MDITITNVVLLLLAGVGSGMVGYLSGLASMVSYPALLAVGLPPLAANVTNTLGLVGTGFGAAMRAGKEAKATGRKRLIQQGIAAAVGGATGAAVLLVTGEGVFTKVVPWLIGLAAVTLLLSPRLKKLSNDTERWPVYLGLLFLVCVYGGYFGAGAGVIYFAVVVVATRYPWRLSMLMKTLLLSVSNLVASLIFIFFAPVNWLAAAIMFAGNLVGGNLGPVVQRFIPDNVSRWIIAIAGFYLAWSLAR